MELKTEITYRTERRRRVTRRLYAGGAVALLAAAAAFIVPVLTGTEEPAYAVSKNADGTVRVEINEFRDADRLEQDLRDAGVTADITYLPPGKACKVGRGETVGRTVTLGPDANAVARMHNGGLDINPRNIGENHTLVLEFAGNEGTPAAEKREVSWRLTGHTITGPVTPCVTVDDPGWETGNSS
ncbi:MULTISPECIES: hypothetical protein [Streptosporangium]|uniref:Uncharacterized protein n=1 Tax=Streptosporangium brasiliense TaxID=47480 RepID=A0ABT9QYW5_9ACTN|nr:hypothetical protein [Streptosporangium brasiliense]MDP9862163.1 hypothetical protein [Streptosporangium brasiliense]